MFGASFFIYFLIMPPSPSKKEKKIAKLVDTSLKKVPNAKVNICAWYVSFLLAVP